MTWEICITADGWQELEDACHQLPRSDLAIAILEDRMEEVEERGGPIIHQCRAIIALWRRIRKLPQDILADVAFRLIESNNRCSNGGWEYYIDRQGYHSIRLPDSPDDPPAAPALPEESPRDFSRKMSKYLKGTCRLMREELAKGRNR